MKKINIFLLISTLCFLSCSSTSTPAGEQLSSDPPSDNHRQYWFDGKAEISSYTLNRARYGQQRDGTMVTIFVTEDFSKSKQVKLDNPSQNPKDAIKVLKMNMISRFVTGIYDYSIMTSTFVPFKNKFLQPNDFNPLKITMSSQDWCGQSYMQANKKGSKLTISTNSYFESEGDREESIKNIIAMDGLWAAARLDPQSLPVGDFDILPFLKELRLMHLPLTPVTVHATLTKNKAYQYQLSSKNSKLAFAMTININHPHEITQFTITHNNQTTTGQLSKKMMSDYWYKNDHKYEFLRDSLDIR